jgi:hypothetical protein
MWNPAGGPRKLEWRARSGVKPLLVLEPGASLSPSAPAEKLATLRELSSPQGVPVDAIVTAECSKVPAGSISWNCHDGTCSLSVNYSVRRRGPPDTPFMGPRGWRCAGAAKCPRTQRLKRALAMPPSALVAREAELLLGVASDLKDELRTFLGEICRHASCGAELLELRGQLPASKLPTGTGGWTVASARADALHLMKGDATPGVRAVLSDPKGTAGLELFCGRPLEAEPVCVLDVKDGAATRFRYIATASGRDIFLQELELGAGKGYLWYDGSVLHLQGATLETRR